MARDRSSIFVWMRWARRVAQIAMLGGVMALAMRAAGQGTAPSAAAQGQEVLDYVNRTADWYRDVAAIDRAWVRSDEVLFREAVGRSSRQALRFGFDYGR